MRIVSVKSVNNIIVLLCYISLFFSVTNIVPFSISYIFIILLCPFIFFRKRTYNKIQIALFALYIYFFLSTLLYSPSAFFNANFYRRDGNFFITFLPMLLIPDSDIDFKIEKIVKYFLIFVTGFNFLFLCIYKLGLQDVVLHKLNVTYVEMYHFLFWAHNAAGGFLAVITAICVGFFINERGIAKIIFGGCIVVNAIGLVATDSRGSIIAILITLIFFLISNITIEGKRVKVGLDIVIIIFMIIVIVSIETYIYIRWVKIDQGEVFKTTMLRYINKIPFVDKRHGTFFVRIVDLWPEAIRRFLKSPILGCGYGSYNDSYSLHVYINNVFAWNMPDQYVYSDAHAHQTFLHVLAETGIIGLALLMILLNSIKQAIINIKDKCLSNGLYIAFIVSILSSFSEHRLFSPSQMIPFIMIFSMTISNKRNVRNFERNMKNEVL